MTITSDWLDLPARMKERFALAECRWASSVDMLDELRRCRDMLPVVRGELGGYMYTGTYTSDQITKRFNRRLENLLAVAELTDVWAEREAGICHADMLGEAWRNLCLNQFHDIICGTCYRSAQEEAHALYREIDHTAATVVRHALEALCSRIRTDEQPGVPIVVLNDAPLPLTAPVTVRAAVLRGDDNGDDNGAAADGELPPGPVSIVTAEGRTMPTMRTEEGVRFLPEPVPAYGYRVFYVVAADHEQRDRDDEIVLENEFLRVEFDISYGSIASCYDKRTGTEYVKPGGRFNRVVAYEDRNDYPHSPDHRWDPWYIRMTGEEYDPHGAYTVSVLCNGAAGKTIRVTRSFRAGDSRHDAVIVQDISLAPGSPLVRIDTHGDWQAARAIVKAEFDLAFPVETVTCDMPYGVAERPAGIESARSVGAEGAEDRVAEGSLRDEPDRPMQMWIDVANSEAGLAVLNNGKYGYDSTADRIRLSLMRAPLINEGEIAGLGPFEFSYALLPHTGRWTDAGVPEHAVSFNRDPLVIRTWAHPGRLPSQTSLFTVSDPRVHLSAVKRAETSSAVVLRLYESSGHASTVLVESRYPLQRAWETNALELPEGARELPVRDRSCIEVSIGGHELSTLVLEMAP